jgi:membrane associated rhomboid family serine protease
MTKESRVVASFIGVLWLVHLIDWLVPMIDLNRFGLIPRTLWGVIGVPLMPFLHRDWGHLLSNSIPLCILLFIVTGLRRDYWQVIASIVIFGGLFLWCIGRSAVHVGASGLVFGLIAFLVASGFAERKPIPVLISLVVGFFYGTTLLTGVIPTVQAHVSWEGHLCGAVAGVLTAFGSKSQESIPESAA